MHRRAVPGSLRPREAPRDSGLRCQVHESEDCVLTAGAPQRQSNQYPGFGPSPARRAAVRCISLFVASSRVGVCEGGRVQFGGVILEVVANSVVSSVDAGYLLCFDGASSWSQGCPCDDVKGIIRDGEWAIDCSTRVALKLFKKRRAAGLTESTGVATLSHRRWMLMVKKQELGGTDEHLEREPARNRRGHREPQGTMTPAG